MIGYAFTLLNTLGAGFLEKVYALAYEVRAAGPIGCTTIRCQGADKDILAGEYFVDLLIGDVLLVALKTVKALDDAHAPGRWSRGSNAIHRISESDRSATRPAA